MASCGKCIKSFTAKQLKITCSECNICYHGACVKMSKDDIDYLNSEGTIWRCEPCSVTRRRSLRLETEATEGNLTLDDLMKAFKELSEDHKRNVSELNTSYESLNEKLEENTNTLRDQTCKITEYLELIQKLTNENKVLKEKMQVLESRLEETEQYSRRNCVEIQGVPLMDDDVLTTVKNFGKAIGVEISENMVDACHTLGKKLGSKDPPGIIVKFVRRMDAETMLAKKRDNKDLSTRHMGLPTDNPVYINESLAPTRRKLLAAAREMRWSRGFKWLWVRGGRILMKKVDNGPTIAIRCHADLEGL